MKEEIIKEAIMFLKGKEKISVREISEHFSLGYNKASKIIDVLENNNLISEFKGETYREVIADPEIFTQQLIFINVNDFI